MAVANGDIVAMRSSAAFVQPQPPRFGKVEDSAGIDVLWEDGLFQQGIPAGGQPLDVIHDCTIATQDIIGKIVRLSSGQYGESGSYDGVVVSCFRRQANGSGTAGSVRALIQLLHNGMWYETTYTSLTRIDKR